MSSESRDGYRSNATRIRSVARQRHACFQVMNGRRIRSQSRRPRHDRLNQLVTRHSGSRSGIFFTGLELIAAAAARALDAVLDVVRSSARSQRPTFSASRAGNSCALLLRQPLSDAGNQTIESEEKPRLDICVSENVRERDDVWKRAGGNPWDVSRIAPSTSVLDEPLLPMADNGADRKMTNPWIYT
jgi:hypothetical protein